MLRRIKVLSTLLLLAPNIIPAAAGQSFPAEPCEQAWSQSGPGDYLFDYSKDTTTTSRGNEGYPKYLDRMKKAQLTDRKDCYKTWTVLIYMAATKDLVPYAYADLLEMEAGDTYDGTSISGPAANRGSSLKSDVIVQFDTDLKKEISRLHMFQTSENKYPHMTKEDLPKLARTDIQSPSVVVMNKDLPTTEKKRLEDFLKWGIEQYPSEHYLVIIWGHGQGWTATEGVGKPISSTPPTSRTVELSTASNALPRPVVQNQMQNQKQVPVGRFGGLGLEESTGYLDIPALKSVLDEVREWSNGDPIDVFASDACLMQSVEDVSHLSKCAKYVCGSEDTESYAGFPYGSLLCHLNSDRRFDGASDSLTHDEGEPYFVAWMIPKLYKESFTPEKGSQSDLDPKACNYLTGCSIWTKHFNRALLPAMGNLGNALLKFMDEERGGRYLDIKDLMQKGPFYQGGTQDLAVFLSGLEALVAADIKSHDDHATPATSALRLRLEKTTLALKDSVVNSAMGSKYDKSPAKGLSIWMPELDEDYHKRIEDYSKSAFYLQEGWKAFMTKMYPKPH